MACRDGSLVSLFRLDGARSTSAASPPSTFATSSRRLSHLSRLRSRFTWFGANTVGRVQAAITKLSAAISGARRQPRSAITSPSASPSRSHCCSVCSPAAATSRAASSGARSNSVLDGQGYEGRRHVTRHVLDDDADLLHLVLDVVGPARSSSSGRPARSGRSWNRSPSVTNAADGGPAARAPGAAQRGMVSDEPDPPAVGGPAIRIARAWLRPRAANVRGCARAHARRGRRRGRARTRSRRCSPCA